VHVIFVRFVELVVPFYSRVSFSEDPSFLEIFFLEEQSRWKEGALALINRHLQGIEIFGVDSSWLRSYHRFISSDVF